MKYLYYSICSVNITKNCYFSTEQEQKIDSCAQIPAHPVSFQFSFTRTLISEKMTTSVT